jgi:hypothetical protein
VRGQLRDEDMVAIETNQPRRFAAFVGTLIVLVCTLLGCAMLSPMFDDLPSWAGFIPFVAYIGAIVGFPMLAYRSMMPRSSNHISHKSKP